MTLSAEQLTGRSSAHVIELAEPACRLHPEAAQAFVALAQAARRAGVQLAAASSFRSFARQLTLWNDKFEGRRPLLDTLGRPLDATRLDEEARVRAILHWSALPGASRHHWGSEVDVFDRAALPAGRGPQLLPSEYAHDGVFARLSDFLQRHAAGFDFFLPYDRDRGGVQPEPWHLSYAPLAGVALSALTVELLEQALRGVPLGGAASVGRLLPEIHARYVRAVAEPPTRPARSS